MVIGVKWYAFADGIREMGWYVLILVPPVLVFYTLCWWYRDVAIHILGASPDLLRRCVVLLGLWCSIATGLA